MNTPAQEVGAAPRIVRALMVVALLGATVLLHAANGVHPPFGARPITERPGWTWKSAESNLPETHSYRARLVIAYCGQCHSPPPPSLHSAAEWRWMIVRMDARAMQANVPDKRIVQADELREIARYYEIHGRN